MEVLQQPYLDIMSMPVGRRKRLCEEKEHLDATRAARRRAKDKARGFRR